MLSTFSPEPSTSIDIDDDDDDGCSSTVASLIVAAASLSTVANAGVGTSCSPDSDIIAVDVSVSTFTSSTNNSIIPFIGTSSITVFNAADKSIESSVCSIFIDSGMFRTFAFDIRGRFSCDKLIINDSLRFFMDISELAFNSTFPTFDVIEVIAFLPRIAPCKASQAIVNNRVLFAIIYITTDVKNESERKIM